MRILGIEASAKSASVCIWSDGKIIAEAYQNNGLTHSKTVLLMIENMLSSSEVSLTDIDRIAVSAGPGSFTGLRIGVAVAKGLSWSTDIPCCGVSTLEAMVRQASFFDGMICAVMDARGGQVYNALFEAHEGTIKRLCNDRAISITELADEIKDEKCVYLLGDGAQLCYNTLKGSICNLKLLPEHLRFQRAVGVCQSAEEIEAYSADQLAINYIRLPQAERERIARQNRKG